MADRTHNTPDLFGDGLEGEAFRAALRAVLADRRSLEAAAFYKTLMQTVARRVQRLTRTRARLSASEAEEVVAEVLVQLMSGSLLRFRGGSIGELMAFVRTVTDRSTWRTIRKRERDSRLLNEATLDEMEMWTSTPDRPDANAERSHDTPLDRKDREYLEGLLRAGSKAEYARVRQVSRAAVTQRMQRIKARIEAMSAQDRARHEVWLRQRARVIANGLDDSH